MAIKEIKASLLLKVDDLYPRTVVDNYHTNQMAEALRANKSLPPILVGRLQGLDGKTWTIVDGIHRVAAYRKVYKKKDPKIPANTKIYSSEIEMRLDAINANVAHGRALTTQDKVRCATLLEDDGYDRLFIASTLNMQKETLDDLMKTRVAEYKKEPIALKRTMKHFAGKVLTNGQAEHLKKAGGLPQSYFVNQVISMLEDNTVNWNDEKLVGALHKLYELLENALKK